MKNIKNILNSLILVITLGLLINNASAQDLRYSQSFANPLKLNPSIMGANPDFKLMLDYRKQWAAIGNGYTTYSFTSLFPIFMKEGKEKLDIGVGVDNDKAGAFGKMDMSLALGYNLKMSDAGNLSFSLLGSYVQKSINFDELSFDDQYVNGAYIASNANTETTLNQKIGYSDVGFGLMWYYNPSSDRGKLNAYLGVSGFHMNSPNESFTGGTATLAKKYCYQGGIKILGANKIDFTPNIRVTSQNGSQEIASGLYMDYRFSDKAKLVLGGWFRRNDAMAFAVGFDMKSFTLGYSYDVITSDISKVVTGTNAHEVTLSYKINRAEKKNIKFNNSPFHNF